MKRLIDAEDLKKEIKSAFSGKIGLTVTRACFKTRKLCAKCQYGKLII